MDKSKCIKVHLFGLEKTPLKTSEVFFSWYNYYGGVKI